jgi:hypothetical protein
MRIVTLLALVAACDTFKPYQDPDTIHQDAAADFALSAQSTHIGPMSVTCCLVTNRATEEVFYLVNSMPGKIDPRTGFPRPSQGELHLANPYGVDFTLGQKVPAFGYGFSPDGSAAFFLTGQTDMTFALNEARVSSPELNQPDIKVVIPNGLDDPPLNQQSFFTPSGRYMIVGARAPGVMNTPDLHVVDINGARDVFKLGKGAFSYVELLTGDDTMIYGNSTASTTLGTPSVEGLYLLNLNAAQSGAKPVLIDTHTAQAQLTADATTLVYLRENGDLVLWDLRDNDYLTLATNVVTFNLGPGRKGPVVWVTRDLAVHVAPKQRPEIVTTAPNAIDLASPIVFTPDQKHMYFFKNVQQQDHYGDLYHIALPPTGDGVLQLLQQRASTIDLYFTLDRLVYLRDIDTTGDSGDMVSVNFDGSDPQPMAPRVATGQVQIAYPPPIGGPLQRPPGFYNPGPPDLSMPPTPPLFANLTGAARDRSANVNIVNGTPPVTGALAFGRQLGGPELTINSNVHVGQFQFSEDGFLLLYVGDAKYNAKAFNYVGSLQVFQTTIDTHPTVPMMDGVAEMGPVSNGALFLSAPSAAMPGLYFVKF